MILKMWVKVGENGWVKVREKLPAQVVDRSRKITAKSIALKDLLPQIPACLALLSKIKHGEVLKIGTDPD